MHARELGILVDGEGAPCVGVPAGATRGRPGGRARDVDGYCSDGFYLHVFLSWRVLKAQKAYHTGTNRIGRMDRILHPHPFGKLRTGSSLPPSRGKGLCVLCFCRYERAKDTGYAGGVSGAGGAGYGGVAGAAAAGCVGHGAGDAAGVHACGCGGVRAAGYAGGGVWQGDCGCAGTWGFEAIERLAGGRAAVFHSGTIAFSWTMPDGTPRDDVMARFDEAADIMMRALRRLGIDARVGEVAGEYCPGQHSVNARGERKLMGVGQRLIRGAAHVGGVVVVGDGERIRNVLVPVYEALGVEWRPETVGSVEDEVEGAEYERWWRRRYSTSLGRGMGCMRGRCQRRRCGLAEGLEGEHLAPRDGG